MYWTAFDEWITMNKNSLQLVTFVIFIVNSCILHLIAILIYPLNTYFELRKRTQNSIKPDKAIEERNDLTSQSKYYYS